MKYEGVIGLEIHAKLKTQSKMFCRCANSGLDAAPNTAVCPICLGFPGALPSVNQQAINLALRTALALQCQINLESAFDRKNYYYPDLPKGYQITQQYHPIAEWGKLTAWVGEEQQEFHLRRLHLEEDSGKLMHEGANTAIDYNRGGVPLIEMVTLPDFRSGPEASGFLKELQQILRYIGASHADLEKGEMRCDVNVSVRPAGSPTLGTKVEIKNMNSFNAIERAIDYEIARQSALLEQGLGDEIRQETRGWDESTEKTVSQRSKEESSDYRYFPEPDLPVVLVTAADIEREQSFIPELPAARRGRYVTSYGLKPDEARILTVEPVLGGAFDEMVQQGMAPQKAAIWLLSIMLAYLRKEGVADPREKVRLERVVELQAAVDSGKISFNVAKDQVFPVLYATDKTVMEIITELNVGQIDDVSAIAETVAAVLAEFPGQVGEYRGGKTALWGFFMGQTMKRSQGRFPADRLQEILQKQLNEG